MLLFAFYSFLARVTVETLPVAAVDAAADDDEDNVADLPREYKKSKSG